MLDAVWCSNESVHEHMAQLSRTTSTGQDSTVHVHLKVKDGSVKDVERVKEAISLSCERAT